MTDFKNRVVRRSVVKLKNIDYTEQLNNINNLLRKYNVQVDDVITAPTLTTFEVNLDVSTNIKAILRLESNFKIATNDNNCRIYQDGSVLKIETKGADNMVLLDDMMTPAYQNAPKEKLLMMIGKDTEGRNTYYDLRKAPHMIVAGTTGSGKTVLLHQMALSLLMNHPTDVDYYFIDAKGNEFQNYGYLKCAKFLKNAKDAEELFETLVGIMESRYQRLATDNCRDIDEFNQRIGGMKRKVVIIDEFADLMLASNNRIEENIVRLAQKSRAAGIHLIIGTQSPRRDVITGLIAANIPTRIALSVTDAIESRIALGRKGAEKLNGKGDMLFLANGYRDPIRCQGALVHSVERDAIIDEIVHSCETVPVKKVRRPIFKRLFG